MIIDLLKTKTLWINRDQDIAKKEAISKLLDSLKFEDHQRIQGVEAGQILGSARAFRNALQMADEVMPLTILEDDCATTPFFKPLIEVPDDADAVYLGHSALGMFSDEQENVTHTVLSFQSAEVLRSLNMLAIHAVTYTSRRYVEAFRRVIEEYAERRQSPIDRGIALLHPFFKIYVVSQPLFYQECPRNKRFTDVIVSPTVTIPQFIRQIPPPVPLQDLL